MNPRRSTLYFLLATAACFLGQVVEAQRWDSLYVQDLPFQYRVNGGLRIINNKADFTTGNGEKFELQNRSLAVRIGGRYKLASYTFSFRISDLGLGTEDEEGKGWGLGLRLYRRYGYFRTRFRFTDGFRLRRSNGEEEFRPDIRLFTAWVYAYHLLSEKKYSLRSSFNQRDRQLQSGGSFLVGGLITRRRFLSDGLTVPTDGGGSTDLVRFAQTNVGFGGGYAYTQLIKKRIFITPVLYAGPEVRFGSVETTERLRREETVSLGLQLRARLSVGWHGTHQFIALIGDYVPSEDKSSPLRTADLRSQLELRMGVQW